ncbi:MAG: IS66 family transposase [Spirochaetaceae bacterium]|nr:IS66 family transposase [Spirochaetaceae bacterium]
MQLETLDATIRDYIKEMESGYEQRFQELKKQIKETEWKYLEIKERYDLLIYKKFGRSAEQILANEKQPPLFNTEVDFREEDKESRQEDFSEIKSYTRKKAGRKPIDPRLHREEKIIDIPEDEKICACGANLTKIGEETSEKLHIIPPRIYVERTVRPKYACRCCEGTEDEGTGAVHIAPVEPTIIPKSIVSPSLLSTIIVQKFEDHLPYYRQEKQFERIWVKISRQDMSNWQQQAYKRLLPLFGLLNMSVKSGPVIQMDETTVQVMGEEGREDTQKSYMWLARGGPPGKTVVLYEYRQTRGAYNAKEFLSGYSGYLQTDGYEGYDAAVKGMPGIIHVGCFAHARRKFYEASKAINKPQSAEEGIKHIRKLYALEDELRSQNLDDNTFLNERKARAGPILEKFKAWLTKRQEEVPPTLLLGKAIHYSLAQWEKMTAYLESPYLTPDNNACENAIRPFVLGRKNWLFCKSPEGAESSCGMYSLIQTAKQNGIIPFQYLMALFEKAPLANASEDWENLLPWNIFTA